MKELCHLLIEEVIISELVTASEGVMFSEVVTPSEGVMFAEVDDCE